jgi:hypothetical protein
MITAIGPNKGNMFQRIAAQAVFGLVFIWAIVKAAEPIGGWWLLWVISFLLLIGNAVYFRFLNQIVFWVYLDDDAKTLEVKYLLQKPKLFPGKDLIAYSDKTAGIDPKNDNSPGIYLRTSDGEKISFSDFNLDNYAPIVVFLDNLKIKKLRANQ